MSGPKTAQYEIAARIEAERQRDLAVAQQRRQAEREQREAERRRLAAAQAAADQAERRVARIERLAESAGSPAGIKRPAAPGRDTADALEAYAKALGAEVARVEASLRTVLARSRLSERALESVAGANSGTQTAAELLAAFSAQAKAAHASPDTPADNPERRRERALKVLRRLASTPANALPADMEALMAEMIGAPDPLRAEALELELKLRVHRFNKEQERREREIAEAEDLLSALPDAAACDAARQDLELVAAGMASFTNSLRARVKEAHAAYQAQLAKERREAASAVLAQTLGDLGYAVEGIENTLFVEGGVAHLNRAEWGDYYVRLRVDPGQQTVNFNMVREGGADEQNTRAADHAAEESWCSGLPQLMKTLASRGLSMQLKRQLAAGALPVQVVAPGAVPEGLKTTSKRRAEALKVRTMKPG